MLKFDNTTTKDGGDASIWVCQSCERAPAAFLCKADSASLCAACDSHIHSANPLSRRHHRVPIQPILGTLYGPLAAANPSELIICPSGNAEDGFLTREAYESGEEEEEDEAASWLLNGNDQPALFSGEVDEYLDLDDYNSCQQHYCVAQSSYGGDSIVPIQYQKERNIQVQHYCFQLGSSEPGYSYPASMSQIVSISSADVRVVPESRLSEASVSHTIRGPKGTIDLFSGPPIEVPTQLSPMDREARVLRYREKKKKRRFDKTIRYASRKAYAETRPRIKGRFAKRRADELDQILFPSAYGIVPSF